MEGLLEKRTEIKGLREGIESFLGARTLCIGPSKHPVVGTS
jgi:hypothetical protein